jgi:uncharacterized protein (DUF362 family)
MAQHPWQHKTQGGGELIASTNSGYLHVPFIDRPPQERNSEVAIVKCPDYGQTSHAVREAIDLLGGIERFCKKGDIVAIKPNAVLAQPPEMAETTHPAVVAAVVRIFKEAGTTVRIVERPAFGAHTDKVYEVTGIKKAALEAGADELWDWRVQEYVEVVVPNPRSFAKVKLPKSLMEADVFVDLPKLKNNQTIGPGALTLGIKSKLGLIPQEDRSLIHRTPVDMAAGCCDIAKAISHLHRLTLIDGIHGQEGSVHYGLVTRPGIIVASPDMVAAEAVCHTIVGYHPLESPCVQIAMKDGLGTGDLSEIDILGTRLQDVYYPFARALTRYVQKYTNVKEYFGGPCFGCLYAMAAVPPIVDPNKKYAVVSGTRALVAEALSNFDEVYLVGECACRDDHQFPGFMEKVNAAKKVIKMGTCPGNDSVQYRKWGGIYDAYMLLSVDGWINSALPDNVRPSALKAAYDRREGRVTKL